VSEEKKMEVLDEIKKALSEVPDRYHADVSKSITHDISVMGQAIKIATANRESA